MIFTNDLLPPELLDLIFKQFKTFNEFATISQVCKKWKEVLSGQNHPFYLFKSIYDANSAVKQYILKPEALTSSHVRMGYELVCRGIVLTEQGKIQEGENNFRKAMYRYGNPSAMMILQMFNNLPGRTPENIDFDAIIKIYNQQETSVLNEGYKTHFKSKSEQAKCKRDLDCAQVLLGTYIGNFIVNYKKVYIAEKGINSSNTNVLSDACSTGLVDPYLEYGVNYSPLFPPFNSEGYIGYAPPDENNAWYFQTEEHQNFLNLEAKIDELFAKHKETAAPNRQLYLTKP